MQNFICDFNLKTFKQNCSFSQTSDFNQASGKVLISQINDINGSYALID